MQFSKFFQGVALALPRTFGSGTWLPLTAGMVLVCSPALSFAQASSGVTGTIADNSGAVVPGAEVAITNIATQTTINVISTSSGTYTATGLLPGRYKIAVTAAGFSKTVKDEVNIEVSTQATIDINLSAGGSDTTVEVTSPLISLNTTQPELGTTIEPAVVAALPVAIGSGRGRQIDSLQFLAPGVQGDTFSHRINGGVDFQTELVFNGIPIAQSETEGYQTGINPPFELVNQFRVERSTFAAQYGLAQGATTYQMASGGNALHGDAFFIARNEFFDATSRFATPGPDGIPHTPTDRENNYGFTIAGPVVIPHLYNGKDKTFFHFSLDFGKTAQTNIHQGTVPTVLEKTGNFSDFKDSSGTPITIYDPLTGLPFAGNIIPTSRISANSASVLQYIPDPDLPGLTHNKSAVANAFPQVAHVFGFVVDHNITSKQSIHYTEWRNTYTTSGFDYDPIVGTDNPLQSVKNNPAVGTVFLVNYTDAVTPRLVATAGFAWVGEIGNQYNVKKGVSFPGTVTSPIAPIFPNIQFSGTNAPTNWGTASGWGDSVNRKLGVTFVNNWLWSKGRHTLNIGGEVRRTYQDDNECQACGGQINFSSATTSAPIGTSPDLFKT